MRFESFHLKKISQYVNRFIDSVASGWKNYTACVRTFVEEEENGSDGQDTEEAFKDNGYNISGWASIKLGHPDEDRGYGSDC
jgi:hypothetical protein